MKRLMSLKAFIAIAVLSSILLFSCSKDTINLPSKEYRLYNYSSGLAIDAGSFTIQQLVDSSASLSIKLASGYLVPGVSLQAYLVTTDSTGTDLTYANLGTVDGTTGTAVINPVRTNDNLPVPYSTLISRYDYTVKILNGSNVQAKGTIQ